MGDDFEKLKEKEKGRETRDFPEYDYFAYCASVACVLVAVIVFFVGLLVFGIETFKGTAAIIFAVIVFFCVCAMFVNRYTFDGRKSRI